MSADLAAVIIALLLLNSVGLLVVGVRVSGQTQDNRQMEHRLTKLEARVDNLPTHRDLLELRDGMTEAVESIASLTGQMNTVTGMLRTIQEHLMENDR